MPNIVAAGRTEPGKGWQTYQGPVEAIYIDVDTRSGGFSSAFKTPIYTCALAGDRKMWDALGAEAVYGATTTGFRVYLRSVVDDKKLTVADAADRDWHINWHGIQEF
ncbi:hypothetical protein ACWD25_20585 [Streptomyces sp. NPDC002920]